MSDFFPHGWVAQQYGVLRGEGYSERAIFVIDKRGIIRYVDVHDIDQQPDNEILFAELEKLVPVGTLAAVRPEPPELQPADEPADDQVVMYCTPWCPDCRRAREFLKGLGVPFTEVDITRDRSAARRVRTWANGNETTPTFSVYGNVMVGYDRLRLGRALGFDELGGRI